MSDSINFTAITTGDYKKIKNFEITYGFKDTKFGKCIIGVNGGKICHLSFVEEGNENAAIDHLTNEWPKAVLKENYNEIKGLAEEVFDGKEHKFNVLLRGTDMQVDVWKELTKLKKGTTVSYEKIAQAIGNPKAIRAVANAIAKNKIAYLIPCHRVIYKTGRSGKYGSGAERKVKMLKHEGAM